MPPHWLSMVERDGGVSGEKEVEMYIGEGKRTSVKNVTLKFIYMWLKDSQFGFFSDGQHGNSDHRTGFKDNGNGKRTETTEKIQAHQWN
ncbi:hypothetical protein F2P81_006418 [Scophthalmus maximus]|uniref:Uncharacterized protein n=1 Tax=Scophthalmus maximus TaxID=52904 RepID=A0A6A4T9D6_SCOMX|nr:hypothetical protein F2P81_006418 [Scophthalmus maximus]